MYSSHEHTVNIMANLLVHETVEHGNGETLETKIGHLSHMSWEYTIPLV